MTKKKPVDKLKKRGRKSLFDPIKHLIRVKELAEAGKINAEIADELNISTSTLNKWMRENPEFMTTIKTGKKYADDEVVQSLYKRAKGYSFVEKKIIENPDGTIRKEVTEKQMAPDPTSMIFWLKNRQPQDWRDKQVQEITGKDGKPIQIANLSDEDLEKIILKTKRP